MAAVVPPSVARGMLPVTSDLAVDGVPVQSGAHSFGQKVCSCWRERCGRLRRFQDADALVKWDIYRHRDYCGYNTVALTVANAVPGQVAYPLLVSLARHPANRLDWWPIPISWSGPNAATPAPAVRSPG
ncbi:MAG: hypothetical protein ACP5QO_09775 [Clostridia bacterium]